MTREELLKQVKAQLGTFKLTSLSERTINEELDDVLEDFGEDEEKNSTIVTKVAKRLKRMEGNLHADVSTEVEEFRKNYKPNKTNKPEGDENGEKDDKYDELLKKFNDLEGKLKADEAKKQKDAALNKIRSGLKGKFNEAGIECKDYFVNAALSKLEIPEENADFNSLIENAEKLYNSELKSAGIETGKPHTGGGNFGSDEQDEDFKDIANIRHRSNPQADKK
jgi:hypothetical protein